MDLLTLILWFVVVGFILFLVYQYAPMPEPMKQTLTVVVIIVLIIVLARMFLPPLTIPIRG